MNALTQYATKTRHVIIHKEIIVVCVMMALLEMELAALVCKLIEKNTVQLIILQATNSRHCRY